MNYPCQCNGIIFHSREELIKDLDERQLYAIEHAHELAYSQVISIQGQITRLQKLLIKNDKAEAAS